MSQLINETQVAELLNLRLRTIRKWRIVGGGPKFIKLGSAVRYRIEDIEAFIEAGVRKSTSDPGVAGSNRR